MTGETKKRLLSAAVLMIIIFSSIWIGTKATIFLIMIFGMAVVDEIQCNLFSEKRFSLLYFLNQILFVVPYLYLNLMGQNQVWYIYGGIGLNSILLYYLFFVRFESSIVFKLNNRMPIIPGILVLLPLLSVTFLFSFEKWRWLLLALLCIAYGMDSGAWYFGRMLGKRKLWEAVSPNKTIEGALFGSLCSGILVSFVWYKYSSQVSFYLFLIFSILGLLSQCGDLIQSKLKRQCDIKDTSALIPGHGGVYDRLDSLLFLSPFFALMVNSYL